MIVGNSKSFVRISFSQKENLRFRNYESFSFCAKFEQPQFFFIFSVFWVKFLCKIFSRIFKIKLSNDSSCRVHVFYNGTFPKKKFP